jgi:hypothetical protein
VVPRFRKRRNNHDHDDRACHHLDDPNYESGGCEAATGFSAFRLVDLTLGVDAQRDRSDPEAQQRANQRGDGSTAGAVPMRTLQEFMGHRDIETTQRYADYAPNANEAAYVNQAFTRERPAAVEAVAS